jgi:hypothetical protein
MQPQQQIQALIKLFMLLLELFPGMHLYRILTPLKILLIAVKIGLIIARHSTHHEVKCGTVILIIIIFV